MSFCSYISFLFMVLSITQKLLWRVAAHDSSKRTRCFGGSWDAQTMGSHVCRQQRPYSRTRRFLFSKRVYESTQTPGTVEDGKGQDGNQSHCIPSQACLSTMPLCQLETFRDWAGKSSDISYYLNSHLVDFHQVLLHSIIALGHWWYFVNTLLASHSSNSGLSATRHALFLLLALQGRFSPFALHRWKGCVFILYHLLFHPINSPTNLPRRL